jgi:trigger factor
MPVEGQEYAFSALVDIMPQIQLGNYKGLKAQAKVHTIDDNSVERELTSLQRQRSKLKSVESDATAVKGNLLVVQQSGEMDGQDVPQFNVEQMPVELGAGQLFPELESALEGVRVGEKKDVTLTLPADYGDVDLAGKTVR